MKLGAVAVVLVACGGKEPLPPAPVSNVVVVPDAGPPDAARSWLDIAMETFTGFRDDMCRCTDKACADEVQERMTKWSTEMASKVGQEDRKPDEDAMKRMTEVGTAYAECMMKAMTPQTGSGSTPGTP